VDEKIPVFDSLAHPTIDGNWILPEYAGRSRIDNLTKQMMESCVKWLFAVGMKGLGNYSDKGYIKFIKDCKNKNIYSVAFYEPPVSGKGSVLQDLKKIKGYGYHGIKLHPRISKFIIDGAIADIIKSANDSGLAVFLCTYFYSNTKALKNTPEMIMEMLSKTAGAKVILVHSGAVRLLEYMEIARAFPGVLLDLSMTICKYMGSSIDDDLSFLFNNFDRRICVGSDFPEYSLMNLRERYDFFSKELPEDKKINIGYKNIARFCGLQL